MLLSQPLFQIKVIAVCLLLMNLQLMFSMKISVHRPRAHDM